ncbi:MAG: DNA/RNA non-specific endonuclease [Alistipes sp.]|nr:DNA/RNA non-specific endonuclease [Alistipes sp.]
MRRRTKRMGGRRTTIYIIVVGLLLAAHYIYDNFAPEAAIAADYAGQVEFASEEPSAEAAPRKATGAEWAELPSMKRQSDDIYITSHHSGAMRNYTVCYSSEHRSPLWVAAPRHRAYTGDVKRVDNYDFDPTLPVNIQTRLNRSYGDYTRGHMLGSAERTASTHMNNQTFYVTNIAPQLRDGFNERGGAWNNLEYFVDKQVCADTLYVVTGAIYERFTDSDGTTIEPRTTKNKNDGKQIGVPTAYYKALLRTRSGRTGKSVAQCKASELKCAAFIVGHRSASGRKPSAEDMISIKELEQMTGIDFFANVPHAPEREAKASDWGL